MGKYKEVCKGLPEFTGTDESYQTRINDLKTFLSDLPDPEEHVDLNLVGQMADLISEHIRDLSTQLIYYKHNAGNSRFPLAYVKVRECQDKIEEALKRLSDLKVAYEQLIIAQFEADEVTLVRLEGVGSLSHVEEPYAQVADKEKFRQWCIENGYEHEMHLMWQKTNAILKERLVAGNQEPPGIKPHVRHKVRFTRSRKG